MQVDLPIQDNLDLHKKDAVKKHLSSTGETLYWSDRMNKINRQGRSQTRVFALTNHSLLNMGNSGFFSSFKAMRVMDLQKINNITYSIMGQGFV